MFVFVLEKSAKGHFVASLFDDSQELETESEMNSEVEESNIALSLILASAMVLGFMHDRLDYESQSLSDWLPRLTALRHVGAWTNWVHNRHPTTQQFRLRTFSIAWHSMRLG